MDTNTSPRPQAVALTGAPFGDDDPRMVFGKAVALGTAVIANVTPAQLDGPTPCDFTVRDLLGHMVSVLHRVAAIGNGIDPMSVGPGVDSNTIADDGWSAAWAEGAHGVMAAFTDDATLDRMIALPWRTATAGEQLLGYTNEISVHTWDLACATGQLPVWDDDVLAVALDAIKTNLPPGERQAVFEEFFKNLPPGVGPQKPPFGDEVTVADDAPMIDRLVAYNGRTPVAS